MLHRELRYNILSESIKFSELYLRRAKSNTVVNHTGPYIAVCYNRVGIISESILSKFYRAFQLPLSTNRVICTAFKIQCWWMNISFTEHTISNVIWLGKFFRYLQQQLNKTTDAANNCSDSVKSSINSFVDRVESQYLSSGQCDKPCEEDQCSNLASCTPDGYGYKCKCLKGYTGPFCDDTDKNGSVIAYWLFL